eukprot:5959505-Pleurochrysis_carterae.AAC.4
MLAPDQVAARQGNCCCDACMRARGCADMVSTGTQLTSAECPHATALQWQHITVKELPRTGVANKRIVAQEQGRELAQRLKPGAYFAAQARADWSSSEELHYRTGHYWLAQAPPESEFSVERVQKRSTTDGTAYSSGDCKIKVGRYFDREVSDASGLAFEECTAPDGASHFVDSTELRAVNFTMDVVGQALPQVRASRGRRAGVVLAAPSLRPHRLRMPAEKFAAPRRGLRRSEPVSTARPPPLTLTGAGI